MKLFADTGNLKEIEALAAFGILDGVTTNPSLIAKAFAPAAIAIVIDAKGPIVALLCCVTIAILALSATIALDRTVRASR